MRGLRAGPARAAVSILASVAMLSGVLANGAAAASSPTTTTTVPVRAKADLVIWSDALHAPILRPFAEKFGKQYGITVAVTGDSGPLESDYINATLAGKGPDILVAANDWIGDLVENGTLLPLAMPTMEQKLFDPIALRAMTYENNLWGVPYGTENVALFRNPALAPNAPTTFEQMVAEGRALVKEGKAKVPFADQVGQTGDAYHMEPFYTSGGGYLFGTLPNGDYNPKDLGVGLPGSIEAGKLIYKYGEKGEGIFTRSIDYSTAISLFASGQTPFLVTGPWALPQIRAAHRAFELSPVPGFKGYGPARPFLGVYGFYVSSKAKNTPLAEEFLLDYVATSALQEALFKVDPDPSALKSVREQELKTNPIARGFIAASKDAQIMPEIPAMDAVWGPLGQAEANIVGGENPATALAQARAAIEKALKSSK